MNLNPFKGGSDNNNTSSGLGAGRIDDIVGALSVKKDWIGDKMLNIYHSLKGNKSTQSQLSSSYGTTTPSSDLRGDEEQGGLLGSIRSNVSSGFTKSTNAISSLAKASTTLTNLRSRMSDVQSAAENWKNFAVLFFFGVFFILTSFFFLPMFVIIPAKFASLFTMGSLCILASVGVMKGFSQFLKQLFQKEKILFTVAYFLTIIGTLYYSVIAKSYLLTLGFSTAQVKNRRYNHYSFYLFWEGGFGKIIKKDFQVRFYLNVYALRLAQLVFLIIFLSLTKQLFSLAFFISTSFPGGTSGVKYVSLKIFGLVKGFCCMCVKTVSNSS